MLSIVTFRSSLSEIKVEASPTMFVSGKKSRVLFYSLATLCFVSKSNANAKSGSVTFGDSFLTLDGFSNQNWNHSKNESNASGSVFAEKLNGIGTKIIYQIQEYLLSVYTSYY